MERVSFIDDARVMSKGQVTIPKKVRNALGIDAGDRVTFIVEDNQVRVINSTAYAVEQFQNQMREEAQKAGFLSEEDADERISQSRSLSAQTSAYTANRIGAAKDLNRGSISLEDFDKSNEKIAKALLGDA